MLAAKNLVDKSGVRESNLFMDETLNVTKLLKMN